MKTVFLRRESVCSLLCTYFTLHFNLHVFLPNILKYITTYTIYIYSHEYTFLFIYCFCMSSTVCISHIMMDVENCTRNQYTQLVKVLYCAKEY